jgi:hypothetical protein
MTPLRPGRDWPRARLMPPTEAVEQRLGTGEVYQIGPAETFPPPKRIIRSSTVQVSR